MNIQFVLSAFSISAVLGALSCQAAEPPSSEAIARKIEVNTASLTMLGNPTATPAEKKLAALIHREGATVFTSEQEAADAFGEKIARQLAGKIDYARDSLVFVSWTSGGPASDKLIDQVSGEPGKYEIVFSVQSFKPAAPVAGTGGSSYSTLRVGRRLFLPREPINDAARR